MRNIPLLTTTGALCLLLAAACAGEESAPTPASTPAGEVPSPAACPEGEEGFVSELRLDGGRTEFPAGQPIEMTFAYTNCGEELVPLAFSDSQRYDFAVVTPYGAAVWRWSADKVFTQELGEETVQPGKTISYTGVWDQSDPHGQPVPPGNYDVHAESAACRPDPRPCPPLYSLRITIVP